MSVDQKAVRLLAEGRVRDAAEPTVRHIRVEGEHGDYSVIVGAHIALCTCPAKVRCSHIEAATARVRANESELELMDAAVRRRDREREADAEELFARLERI